MSTIQQLPPDQRAVLSLLLRQRKSYGEIASMLGISPQAVHDRAHAALLMLSPGQARELSPARREQVGEFLLGQLPQPSADAAREMLDTEAPARAWAQVLHAKLRDVAGGNLPTLGGGAEGSAPAAGGAAARTAQAPVSRAGGAVLLVALVAIVAAVVVLVLDNSKGSTPHAAAQAPSTSSATTSTTSSSHSSSSGAGQPHVDGQLNLTPTTAGGRAVGVVFVLSQGSQRAFYLQAEHLAPSKNFFYVLWLVRSSGSATALGQAPSVTSDGRMKAGGALPANAASYSKIVLARETSSSQASTPGVTILEGAFSLH
jgi:hypothetical protein